MGTLPTLPRSRSYGKHFVKMSQDLSIPAKAELPPVSMPGTDIVDVGLRIYVMKGRVSRGGEGWLPRKRMGRSDLEDPA